MSEKTDRLVKILEETAENLAIAAGSVKRAFRELEVELDKERWARIILKQGKEIAPVLAAQTKEDSGGNKAV